MSHPLRFISARQNISQYFLAYSVNVWCVIKRSLTKNYVSSSATEKTIESQYLRKGCEKQSSVWQAHDGRVNRKFFQALLISLRKDVDIKNVKLLAQPNTLAVENRAALLPAGLSAVPSTAPTPPAAVLAGEGALLLFQSQRGSESTHIQRQHAPPCSASELQHNQRLDELGMANTVACKCADSKDMQTALLSGRVMWRISFAMRKPSTP